MTEEKQNLNISVTPLESEGLRGDGIAKWYVAHTYSGCEDKVKANIERMVEHLGKQSFIQEVAVPKKDVIVKDKKGNIRRDENGKIKTKSVNIYPGYVMVKMIVNNDTWYLVRNIEGVTGFIGGSKPVPLTTEEVIRMQMEEGQLYPDIKAGDKIRVVGGGLLNGKLGIVEEVLADKHLVKAKVLMFNNRETSVELEFEEVEKI